MLTLQLSNPPKVVTDYALRKSKSDLVLVFEGQEHLINADLVSFHSAKLAKELEVKEGQKRKSLITLYLNGTTLDLETLNKIETLDKIVLFMLGVQIQLDKYQFVEV